MSALRKSSSFTLSPKKRSSLGNSGALVTPLTRRQSFTTSGTIDNLLVGAQNNDEAERKVRQLSRLQSLQARTGSSPTATPNDRRRSINSFAGLTHQQLVEHYSTCIQLSAENKINIKNAFNLQLIDYMTEMLKRKDSDMNNFQVASCTLDASTKIYAYRVDSVHTDTLKMAGGLGRTKDKPGGEDREEGHGEQNVATKRRKGKHCTPIETNLKNINVTHFDLEFDIDPLFKRMASRFDEGCSGGNQFLNTLQLLDDNCQLILDSETTLRSGSLPSSQAQSQIASIPPIPDLGRLISNTFSSFEFLKWQLSDEDPFSETAKGLNHDADHLANDHAFDMNAIPEPLDGDGMDQDRDDFDGLAEDVDNDGTIVTVGRGGCAPGGPRPPPPQLEILHLKDRLANAPLEYSYFDSSRMSAWAGPGHWKLKPLVKSTNRQSKSKDVQKKDYCVNYNENSQLESHFALLRRATKLTSNTVKKWTFENTTLPIDLHYNPNQLCKLYFRPSVIIRRQNSATTNVDVEEYNYDNKNDKENYCPDIDDGGSNYEDAATLGYDDTAMFSQTILPSQPLSDTAELDDVTKDFHGDNLVEAPNKIAKINIGYAKTAKKMDMRKLKASMWGLLSDPNFDKENKTCEGERNPISTPKEAMDVDYRIKFSSLYVDLKPRLPTKMSENLSVPLAFIALLHLANEQSLKLDSLEVLGDFVVCQN